MSDYNCSHKLINVPYLQMDDWHANQKAKGLKQTQCPDCKLWLYPEEL